MKTTMINTNMTDPTIINEMTDAHTRLRAHGLHDGPILIGALAYIGHLRARPLAEVVEMAVALAAGDPSPACALLGIDVQLEEDGAVLRWEKTGEPFYRVYIGREREDQLRGIGVILVMIAHRVGLERVEGAQQTW